MTQENSMKQENQVYFSVRQLSALVQKCKKEQTNKYKEMEDVDENVMKLLQKKNNADQRMPEVDAYLRMTIFPLKSGSYFYYDKCNYDGQIKLQCVSEKTFKSVYGKHLNKIYKNWNDVLDEFYETNVSNDEKKIDHKKRIINLSEPFNYNYKPEHKCSEQTLKDVDFFMNDFLKRIICDGNEALYDNFMHLMSAYANRVKSEIILVLVGMGGIGKSLFVEQLLGGLFGKSCVQCPDSFLRGNSDFNSQLLGASIAYINETCGKGEEVYKQAFKTLKNISTAEILTIRNLYQEPFQVTNIINFILITNHINDIIHDRRMMYLEPNTSELKNMAFYTRLAKIIRNRDAMQHMFNLFYTHSPKNFNILEMKLATTEVNNNLIDGSIVMSSFSEFFYKTFVLDPKNGITRKPRMNTDDIFKLFGAWKQAYANTLRFADSTVKQNIRQILLKAGMANGVNTYHTDPDNVMKRIKLIMNWKDDKFVELDKKYDFDDDDENECKKDKVATKEQFDEFVNTIDEYEAQIENLKRKLKEHEALNKPEQVEKRPTKIQKKKVPKDDIQLIDNQIKEVASKIAEGLDLIKAIDESKEEHQEEYKVDKITIEFEQTECANWMRQ
jgi:hypothetical protein